MSNFANSNLSDHKGHKRNKSVPNEKRPFDLDHNHYYTYQYWHEYEFYNIELDVESNDYYIN